MEALRKRSVAKLITAILIIAAILFGSHRSLTSLRNGAMDVFVNGVSGDGIGIASDLNRRIDLTLNLLTIAGKYLPTDDVNIRNAALAADMLTEALYKYESTRAPSNIYDTNRMITDSTSALISLLTDMPLSDRDSDYCRSISADLKSRNNTIMHDAYNAMALEFNQKLTVFPANMLAPLTSVERLEVFR